MYCLNICILEATLVLIFVHLCSSAPVQNTYQLNCWNWRYSRETFGNAWGLLFFFVISFEYIRNNWEPFSIWELIKWKDYLGTYFNLPNNHAANLINFLENSNLHTLIPTCTFINFWKLLAKTFIFTNEKWNIPTCMPLFQPALLLIFGI